MIEVATIEPGVYEMSNAEYHAAPGISKSGLDLIDRSPSHYRQSRIAKRRDETPALVFGSLVHTMVLEPALVAEQYAIEPDLNKRTKEGKESYAAWYEATQGRRAVSADVFAHARKVSDAVLADEYAKATLCTGVTERSIFWRDRTTGVLCKCRPDRWREDLKIAIDLKTTLDCRPDEFRNAAQRYRYHVQAAWYLTGIAAAYGVPISRTEFVFVAVEKDDPCPVAVYQMDKAWIRLGEEEAMKNLATYAECLKTDTWPAYTQGFTTLYAPKWAMG